MPNFQEYRAKLAWVNQLNERFVEMHFELVEPSRLKFVAGQYVMISIPETGHKRSYSITSTPSVEHAFELLVDLAPQGPGTTYLKSLTAGQEIQLLAPVGNFVLADPRSEAGQVEQELFFVATGSGIAPFKSMINDLLIEQNDSRPITLIWGLHSEADQFWYDDWQILARENNNFSFQPVLSQPQSQWPFHKGYVTDVLSIMDDFANRGFYLCGNSQMIKDARELLTQKGVAVENIHNEAFF